PKSKAEMISGIVVAGVIVVASIVAMIIVAVVIQHQKYSGLGRSGLLFIKPPYDSDVNSLNHERRIGAFEGGFKRKYKVGEDDIQNDSSLKEGLSSFIPFDDPDTKIKIKYRNIYLKLELGLLIDGMRYQHILNQIIFQMKTNIIKKEDLEEGEENKEEKENEYQEELEEKVNFDSEYGNDIWGDFDEDGQDEPDQQTGKEGAETEEEENELLIKIRIQKKKQSCS
ncbi:MAG: hypothetical protein EZS28_048312, partial [Streblomastix strix]